MLSRIGEKPKQKVKTTETVETTETLAETVETLAEITETWAGTKETGGITPGAREIDGAETKQQSNFNMKYLYLFTK